MTLPSVTQIISPWQDFSQIPEDVLQAACDRGRAVHGLCAARAKKLFIPPVHEDYRGYYESFVRWFDYAVVEVVAVERELIEKQLRYKGHPDLIARLRGDHCLTVIDYKTPITHKLAWCLQCAGYRRLGLGNDYDIGRNLSLRLRPDGSRALITEYSSNYAHDLAVFLNAKAVWEYFNS
ncbi:MAG: hypothetical protein RBR16_13480 [Syntrophus sp. (in: bacteria)]|nr:hypothetical protein [Syntrophus sp. (in: bacteria)]